MNSDRGDCCDAHSGLASNQASRSKFARWAGPLWIGSPQLAAVRQEGAVIQIGAFGAVVRFSFCGRSSPNGIESKSPGVWLEPAADPTAHFGLRIVTAVPWRDDSDLRLALEELYKAIDGDEEGDCLVRELLVPSPCRMVMPLDLIWEANAPISKALSPVSQYLHYLGGEVVASGLAAAVRETFSLALHRLEGRRIDEDGARRQDILAMVSPRILSSCDQLLGEGRGGILVSVLDPGYRVFVVDLPIKLVDAMVDQFRGRRILCMRAPV